MYFKKIEMNGFKSFADPVTIDFQDGITCVVGPNGSGKSNISDALRWVLGEQSAKTLRGGKMEEVIFSGTSARKSKSMAEVSLVIDNSTNILPIDFSEVQIKRRLYRSGESEYSINGNQCRLRDVRELIMDTGIGVDGYSLIGQGKIAEIVSEKPEDRREIFEEAAGISKYRNKKAEAERKLDRSINNRDRLNDIISEIEMRIGPLKEESQKAKEYVLLRDRHKELEINIALKSIENIHRKNGNIAEELTTMEERLTTLTEKKVELEKALAESRSNNDQLEQTSNNLKDALLKNVEETNILKSNVELNEERRKTADKDKARLESELSEIATKLENELEAEKKLVLSVEEASNEVASLRSSMNEKLEKAEELNRYITGVTGEITSFKNTIIQLHREKTEQQSEISSIRNLEETLTRRKEQLAEETAASIESNREADNVIERKRSELLEIEAEIEQLNTKKLELDQIRKESEANVKWAKDIIEKLQISIGQMHARKKTIEEMEANYEGYNDGVKHIMKSDASGLSGVIAELIDVSPEYEAAIETALGADMQNVVIRDIESASEAIELLKQEKAGKVTFLPLDDLKIDHDRPEVDYGRPEIANDADGKSIPRSPIQKNSKGNAAEITAPTIANVKEPSVKKEFLKEQPFVDGNTAVDAVATETISDSAAVELENLVEPDELEDGMVNSIFGPIKKLKIFNFRPFRALIIDPSKKTEKRKDREKREKEEARLQEQMLASARIEAAEAQERALALADANAQREADELQNRTEQIAVAVQERTVGGRGFIGYAIDKVKFDPEYSPAFEYLLGDTIIADNLDNAISLSEKNEGFKVVTLAGEVITPCGAVTGGSNKNRSVSAIARKAEIAELEKALKSKQTEREDLFTNLEGTEKDLETTNEQFAECDAKLKQIEIDKSSISAELRGFENKDKEILEKREKWDKEMRGIDEELQKSQTMIDKLVGSTGELDEKEKSIELEIEQREAHLEAKKDELSVANEEVVKARLVLGSADSAKINNDRMMARIKETIGDLTRQQNQKERQLQDIFAFEREANEREMNPEDMLAEKALQKTELEEKIEAINTKRSELMKFVEENTVVKEQLEQELETLKTQKADMDVKRAKQDTQVDSFKERLWDEFEISYAAAMEKRDPEFVMSTAQKENREVKGRLKELGDVNVGAIKDYEETSERYEFYTAQRDDVTEAIETLQNIITETDKTIKSTFKESFDVISANFSDTFGKLFGGGRGQLVLEDPSNPLDSGIMINAQPPGKKLQNMNLLSGGEKTMTAIALMFSILKAKPTPFCILDEVEAALDDNNIKRFADYLQEFNKTQFTLVTHQKATMEYADALYGVTMPEKGISRILSLKLGDSATEEFAQQLN